MDGTASLSYLLSSLQKEGMKSRGLDRNEYAYGGIVMPCREESKFSRFTAADKSDGARHILEVLGKCDERFIFLHRRIYERFPKLYRLCTMPTLRRLKRDAHLLYCAWENRDSTLVSQAQFEQDMLDVYARMRKSGIDVSRSNLFIPPYEYYNERFQLEREIRVKACKFYSRHGPRQTWYDSRYEELS